MSKTRIVVVKRKQVFLTGVFTILAIILVILMICLVLPKKANDDQAGMQQSERIYRPGIYNSTILLGASTLNLEVALDTDHVSSIRITNIDDSIATMYPLIVPSVSEIGEQLRSGKSIDSIELAQESQFTQTLLLNAIREILEKYESE